MPNPALLARAARRMAAFSFVCPDTSCGTDHHSQNLVLCDFCPATFKDHSDHSRHIVLAPACRDAHRQATAARKVVLPGLPSEGVPSRTSRRSRHTDELLANWTSIQPPLSHAKPTSPTSALSSSILSTLTCEANAIPPTHSLNEGAIHHDAPPKLPDDGDFVEHFPGRLAGSPISKDQAYRPDAKEYLTSCGHLANPDYFEAADDLVTASLSNAMRDRLLKSKVYQGKTPWANCKSMLADVDKLPHGPEWTVHTIELGDGTNKRSHYLVGRNIIDVVRDLIGDRRFRNYMRYAPERHWTSRERKTRVYGEMWTGNWWWRHQIKLSKTANNATIAPIIISSDRTSLSVMSGGQEAYPVYVTIGNISKSLRRKPSQRATVLLGYLPYDKFEEEKSKEERARLKGELTHRAMKALMTPVTEASQFGVDMWCADGYLRRVFPEVAAFVGDWPEQNLMACTSQGGCPICLTPHADRGNLDKEAPLRRARETSAAINSYYMHDRHPGELVKLNLKPWKPWWAGLPYTNFHACITPDLLHQLHQGLFKSHVLPWVFHVVGVDIADSRFAAMSRAHGMRHFTKRVSKIRQWTGRESKELMKQILPILSGLGSTAVCSNFTALVRTALDFMYQAHASRMTDEDVCDLEDTLAEFHRLKKVIPELGIYEDMSRFNNVPKIHMLSHYAHAIRELGTPDGYNTESPEHLHIIFAKRPYRASNKVKPKAQMVTFIQRREAMRIHATYLEECYGPRAPRAAPEDDADEDSEYDAEDDERTDPDGYNDQENDNSDGDSDGGNDELDISWIQAQLQRVRDQSTTPAGQIPGHYGNGGDIGDAVTTDGEAACALADGESRQVDSCADAGKATLSVEPLEDDPDPDLGKNPSSSVIGTQLVDTYGTFDLVRAIGDYMGLRLDISDGESLISLYHTFPVWHRFVINHRPLPFAPGEPAQQDIIRAFPPHRDREGAFDTVLFLDAPDQIGLHRYRAGRIRAIFALPAHLSQRFPDKLVFLELFQPFSPNASLVHGMHETSPQMRYNGTRRTVVIPLQDVVAACHLAPHFRKLGEELCLSPSIDVLALGSRFLLSPYYNHYMFLLMQHWRRSKARVTSIAPCP